MLQAKLSLESEKFCSTPHAVSTFLFVSTFILLRQVQSQIPAASVCT